MRNSRDGPDELGETLVPQRQGIAAAHYDFADRWIPGDGFHGRDRPAMRELLLGVRKVAPKAVTAMDGAGAGGDQEYSAGIFVQHAGRRGG